VENHSQLPDDREALKEQRKKASQIGLLLGALALVIGSIVCLIYLLLQKPWKFH
jgi:hypothetical protein